MNCCQWADLQPFPWVRHRVGRGSSEPGDSPQCSGRMAGDREGHHSNIQSAAGVLLKPFWVQRLDPPREECEDALGCLAWQY